MMPQTPAQDTPTETASNPVFQAWVYTMTEARTLDPVRYSELAHSIPASVRPQVLRAVESVARA